MLQPLLLQIVAGILGLFLAQKYVTGVEFTGPLLTLPENLNDFNQLFSTLVFVGAFLGFLNYFIKPLLKTFALPLRIITLNLFSIVIAMFLVWLVATFSTELIIKGLKPLFFTTLIVWGIGFVSTRLFASKPALTNRE
jgi:putative membrane protein